jgi:hypothetical protein
MGRSVDDADLLWLAEVMANPQAYAETFLHIRDKRKRLVRFRSNAQQRRLWQIKGWLRERGRGVRMIILKARQMGVTTVEQLDSFHMVARRDGGGDGREVLTLAHDTDSTEKIFKIATRCWEEMDPEFRPRKRWDNKRELDFPDLNSWFGIKTAGAKAGGRGSTLSKVHGSEVAQWSRALEVHEGLNEAVPLDGEIVYESTAFGAAGLFYETWQMAKEANGVVTLHDTPDRPLETVLQNLGRGGRSRWIPVFFPWFEFAEYALPLEAPDELHPLTPKEEALVEAYGLTLEQLKFRRAKIADYQGREEVFDQEYPSDDVTCFLLSGRRLFNLVALTEALGRCRPPAWTRKLYNGELRVWRDYEEGHRYILGVDSSEGVTGGDHGVIHVYDAETWEQVAVFAGLPSPHDLAVMVDILGRGDTGLGIRGYSNPRRGAPLVVPEINNTGHAVVSVLLNERKYPRARIYHRTHYADPERKKTELRVGWSTDSATKWLLLDDLGQAIVERAIHFNDRETVMELIAYQLGEDGKPGAPEGAHDDHVIAAGLAYQGRKYRVQLGEWRTTDAESDDARQHPMQRRKW